MRRTPTISGIKVQGLGLAMSVLALALAVLLGGTSHAQAAKFKKQTTLTLSATGDTIISHGGDANKTAIGGYLFFDVRPSPYISFGIGTGYTTSLKSPRWDVNQLDLGGRIFPMGYGEKGEFYLQGGVGTMPLDNDIDTTKIRARGTAGIGYRLWTQKNYAWDFGLAYNVYSPRTRPVGMVGVKVGVGFNLGGGGYEDGDKTTVTLTNREIAPTYVWQEGDTLEAVAQRVYGDKKYGYLISDANKDLVDDAGDLKVGVRIMPPKIPQETATRAEEGASAEVSMEGQDGSSEATEEAVAVSTKTAMMKVADYQGRDVPRYYVWKRGDDLQSVADRIYGDADLYPLLVDANKKLILPDNLVRGTRVKVPPPPKTEAELAAIRAKADESFYIQWQGATLRRSGR